MTIAVIAICFAALASNRVAPDVALIGGVAILLIGGVLTPQQAFAGLANEAVVTIGVLYISVWRLPAAGDSARLVDRCDHHHRSAVDVAVPTLSEATQGSGVRPQGAIRGATSAWPHKKSPRG